MLDLVVRDGMVVDGSGRPARKGDVGIRSGRIVDIGDVDASAAHRVIDAGGRVVAPGFVDVHTHYDAQAFWDPALTPSPFHGVTTVLAGNCGFTIAPLREDTADYLMRMLARVEGMPLEALAAGVAWDWRSTSDFLDQLDGRLALNAGFMVGHSAMRRQVMGDAATERACEPHEVAAMQELLRAGLRAGGLGLSSSRGIAHTDGDGQPVPSRFATDEELVALAGVCAEFAGTSLELIPEQFDEHHTKLMTRMSQAAGRPLNWNVMTPNAATLGECLDRLSSGTYAARHGAKVVGLAMPVPWASRRTFLTGFVLDSLPGWSEPMMLPPEEKLRVLRDPDARRHLDQLAQQPGLLRHIADWGRMVISETFSPGTERFAGRLVDEIAAERGTTPFDALLDIVCEDELRTTFHVDPPVQTTADWEARARVIRDPRAILGGSDAGAHLDSLATFNYATVTLAQLVREHELLGIEEAVHLLTEVPARLYGLRDRGRLAPGARADVVIFDPDTVDSEPVSTRFDLPGGVGRLYAGAVGVEHVLVNGVEIVHDGELTGANPGTLLRSGRDTVDPPLD